MPVKVWCEHIAPRALLRSARSTRLGSVASLGMTILCCACVNTSNRRIVHIMRQIGIYRALCMRKLVGTGVLCQEQDCKQLCKRMGNSFALLRQVLLEAERSVAERGFQKRRATQSRREMRRLSSCSVRKSSSAIL